MNFLLHVDVHLGAMIENFGSFSYGILFLIVFAETGFVLAPFLPGDSLLFTVGMFSSMGSIKIQIIFFIIWLASFLGDNVNYWVGYHFGKKLVSHPRIPLNQQHIDRTEEFFKNHGKKAIIISRFLPIIRTFAPFVAGVSRIEYKKFLLLSLIGGFCWVTTFIFLGYFFGNMKFVRDNFSAVIIFTVLISFLPATWKIIKTKMLTKNL